MDVKKLFEAKMDRRKLINNLGMLGAGATLAACTPRPTAQTPDLDTQILNFALNLEYLEAEFYLAAIGRTPSYDTDGVGTVGAVTGGAPVDFGDDDFGQAVRAYAEEIATDEERHVIFLRQALGDRAVARPAINIGGGAEGAFGVAAMAAGATAGVNADTQTALSTFSPYTNALFFLHGAFIFEDVGVTAYKGASPLVTNETFLEAAAGILGVEAYHASEVRTLLYQNRSTVAIEAGAVGSSVALDVQTIVGAISALRAALGNGKDQGIVLDGRANIVPTDNNSIAFSRSPREVLNIVYGAVGAASGLFFPNGVNGTFTDLLA